MDNKLRARTMCTPIRTCHTAASLARFSLAPAHVDAMMAGWFVLCFVCATRCIDVPPKPIHDSKSTHSTTAHDSNTNDSVQSSLLIYYLSLGVYVLVGGRCTGELEECGCGCIAS